MQTQKNIVLFIIITTFLLLILIVFILLLLFLHQKRQLSYNNELKVIKVAYEKELLKTQLEIQEETFEHISLELHDNVGQFLSLAKLYLTTIENDLSIEAREKVEASVSLLSSSLTVIRNVSRSLNTENIKSSGLIKTIEQQIIQIEGTGVLKVNFNIFGKTCFMEEKKELVLFRIVQEAFNNILKHSKASRILIEMKYEEHCMLLHIQDNGVGFNANNISNGCTNQTSGLNNIMKRSRLINATHEILSIPGVGTTINIITPL